MGAPGLGGRRWRDGEATVASARLGDGREREREREGGSPKREREMEEGARKKPRRENFPPFNLGCPGFLWSNPVAPIAKSLKNSDHCIMISS